MEFCTEVQYVVDRSIRQGLITNEELSRLAEAYDPITADAVAEQLANAGVRFANDRDVDVTPETNVLLNDLTLVELISLCLQLPMVEKTKRRLQKHVLKRRSYELDLWRLSYLEKDYEWYYLSPEFVGLQRSVRRLFKSGEIPFARDWQEGDNRANPNYLKGLLGHPAFVAQILPRIRKQYLTLRPVRLLVDWIQATGKPTPNMTEIVEAGLKHHGADKVRRVLLSDQPSTAGSVLESRRDVCFFCAPWQCCEPLRNAVDTYQVLTTYRSMTLDAILASQHPGDTLANCLLADGLIVKFFLPYSIVVSAKRWMLQIAILRSDNSLLDKSHGKYCPRYDTWALARSHDA